ncbi:MAG: N-formylglutamate amidohydrolase [Nitrospira sp. BO4]|jgi:N-formylglutamate amidohydrolase|nr:N-formylglutamate amidohydrolase [Nitrospira sp. BO4]
MHFEIIRSARAESIPLLVHVPHSSTNIPNVIRRTLCLTDDELRREVLCMTDWYTDRLFEGVLGLGGTLFVNRLSRLVVDPERFPDDGQEIMAARGMGAVYMKTADGRPLRTELASVERSTLLDTYFHPYAQALADVVSQLLSQHGRCVILDGHSFPSKPLPYELNQETLRPQICLGTDEWHTPESLVREMEVRCFAQGLHVARNTPFAGTYVPQRYWHTDSRVSSIMIEIQRDLYMDEQTGAETAGLKRIQELITGMVGWMAQW